MNVDPNLKLFDNGAYLYRSDSGKFDIDMFNRDIKQYENKRQDTMKDKLALKLKELNTPEQIDPIYGEPVGKIIIDTKDAVFETLDDMLQFKFGINTFMKKNRLFYLGLFLILLACFLFLYNVVFVDQDPGPIKQNNEIFFRLHLDK